MKIDSPDIQECEDLIEDISNTEGSERIDLKTQKQNYIKVITNLLNLVEGKIKRIPKHVIKKPTEEMALRYITGFAINHVLLKKVKCNICIANLIKPDDVQELNSTELLKYKNISSTNDLLQSELLGKYKRELSSKDIQFINPADDFFNILYYNFQIYNICKANILHIHNLKEKIINCCIKYSILRFNNYFDIRKNECVSHKILILDYIVKILLRRNCCWMRYEIKKSTKQYSHLKKYKN